MASVVRRQSTKLDIEIDRGADFALEVVWRTGLATCSDVSSLPTVDVTGFSATLTIRPLGSDGTEDVILTEGSGITLAAAGAILIELDDVAVDGFQWSKAHYTLKMTDTSGTTTALLHGEVTVFSTLPL